MTMLATPLFARSDSGLQETLVEGMAVSRLNRIGGAMQGFIDRQQLAGVTTLVVRNGKVVQQTSVGDQDRERKIPMADNSIYRIYSMTKPVTAVAVLMLAEEGRFLLEEPVSKYLSEFSRPVVYVGHQSGEIRTKPARPITIRQLLTHTSGLTYPFIASPVATLYRQAGISGGALNDAHESLADLVTTLASMPLVSQPGTAWHYGMSIDVLGRLVEVVSGQDLRTFMVSRIFQPLQMVDTDFLVPDEKLQRFAAAYRAGPDNTLLLQDDPARSLYRAAPKILSGGSGLVSTAQDYARFAQMLLNGGTLDGVRLLSPLTVKFMLSNQLPAGLPTETFAGAVVQMTYGDDWGMGFGLGGFVLLQPEKTGIPASVGSYGWAGAAGTNFWIDPELNMVGIVMTQLLPGHKVPVREVMQAMTYQAVVGNQPLM